MVRELNPLIFYLDTVCVNMDLPMPQALIRLAALLKSEPYIFVRTERTSHWMRHGTDSFLGQFVLLSGTKKPSPLGLLFVLNPMSVWCNSIIEIEIVTRNNK